MWLRRQEDDYFVGTWHHGLTGKHEKIIRRGRVSGGAQVVDISSTSVYVLMHIQLVSLLLSSFGTSCGLGCHPFPPPVRAFSFLMAHRAQHSHCSSTFIECCYNNSRSLAFRGSICAQEKVPTNLDEYALGGTRTHEIDL